MISSEKIAKESNRYHHNMVALIRDHKVVLESINKLKVDKIESRNGFRYVYWLDNQQLLYLAGVAKKDALKKVLMYYYLDTRVNTEKDVEISVEPKEESKWYSFLKKFEKYYW